MLQLAEVEAQRGCAAVNNFLLSETQRARESVQAAFSPPFLGSLPPSHAADWLPQRRIAV